MGNTQSPSSDPRFASASRAFTQKELEDLKLVFESLAAQSSSGNGKFVSPSMFQKYFELHGPIGKRMFDLVSQHKKDGKMTFQDLIIAKGTYEKGTRDEKEEFIFQLVDITGDGIVTRSDLQSVLTAMFGHILSVGRDEPGSSVHGNILDIFLSAACFSGQDEGHTEKHMSVEDFRSWCNLIPSLRKFLGNLLMPPDPVKPGFQVPRLVHNGDVDSNLIIMRKEYAWHIGGALSQHELDEWKLLYHSSFNGLSFNTFLGNISDDEGPTILLVKDKEGYVYGGYASQPWERHGDFYGDMKSFLFQLYPKASIFRPTGANANIQWCAANFTSESIPNGIGFGGQINHLGLFLSGSFDQGHTYSCITFGSPCLSKSNQIYPEVIECWNVVPKETQGGRNNATQGTILERFKEDRHMLNMVGLANSSN